MKICTKCKKEYPATLEYFHKGKNYKNGLHLWCKKCKNKLNKVSSKNWYLENKEKAKQISKNWKQNNKEYHNKLNREWAKKHPEYNCLKKKRILNATPKDIKIQNQIKKIYRNRPRGYEVDHIIPLFGKNISGLHIPKNLQYLTPKENKEKGNKFIPYSEVY